MKEKVLIAWDLSTTVLGFTVFNIETKTIIEISYYKFKEKTMIEKSIELETFFNKVCESYINIEYFVIEERLKSFAGGGTNAEAMLKLAQLNFLAQYLFHRKGIAYKELNVNTARKLAYDNFHSLARKIIGVKQKEFAFKLVLNELGEERFPTKINKSGKNKGNQVFLEEAKDMADSFILGKACFKILS